MHALRVLEYESVVAMLVRRCETALGVAGASEIRPSFDEAEVWEALAGTGEAYDLLGQGHPPALGAVRDVVTAVVRAQKGGVLGGSELFQIADAMGAMRALKAFLKGGEAKYPRLCALALSIPEHPRLDTSILDALLPDGDCKDTASPKLQTLRSRKRSTAAKITERIHSYTTGKTREWLSDPIYTVRDGRYVVPLKAEHRGKIRGIVHDTSGSGQTIYVEPEDVLQLGNALREIDSHEREEIVAILRSFSERVGVVADEIVGGLEATGQLDILLAKAKLGADLRGAMPERAATLGTLEVQLARHPLLDQQIVVPLDFAVGGPHGSVLITGPNTGGKTVAMKCVGLCVLMAQSGMMPPCAHARLGPFSQVWADIGDEQSLQQSLSTFSGHIRNISNALKGLRPFGLVLMDEIGAGTDPAEGAALAKAILLDMQSAGATIVASTHYGELKNFAYNTDGFTNAAMEFDSKTLKPTYRLLLGAPGASHALKIAERYGIPTAVIEHAKGALGDQAQDMAQMLERLEESQRLARRAQSEADRRASEAKRLETEANAKLLEADEIRRNARDKASKMLDDVLRQIRLEADEIFEQLRKGGGTLDTRDTARKSLRSLQEIGSAFADEVRDRPRDRPETEVLKPGDRVKAEGFTQVGIVLQPAGAGQFIVQMGALKMTIKARDLRKVAEVVERKAKVNLGLAKAQTAHTEIQLIAMRAEDASRQLERFLDDAVLGGVPSVRIVHGKGEGILRKITQEILKKNRSISTFRDGEPSEGGAGVTIAEFR